MGALMRLPWVGRGELDGLLAGHAVETARASQIFTDTVTRLMVDLDRERAEKAYWVERYIDAVTPAIPLVTAPVVPVPVVPKEKSLIAEAIKEESGGDPRLSAWYRKRVKEMKADGATEGDIVAAIRKWESTEDTHKSASE